VIEVDHRSEESSMVAVNRNASCVVFSIPSPGAPDALLAIKACLVQHRNPT
jgi:hypothetical protein